MQTGVAHSFIICNGNRMSYLIPFFAGAFLCNCIAHLCSGLQGHPFPTPFATPRGVGNSSPIVNFLWGVANLLLGLLLLSRHPAEVGVNPDFIAITVGVLVMGVYLSIHFGEVLRLVVDGYSSRGRSRDHIDIDFTETGELPHVRRTDT
jgi:hypothetical protein